jgi:hypothetical protein
VWWRHIKYVVALVLDLRVLAGARDKVLNLRRLFVVLYPHSIFVEPLSIVKNGRLCSARFVMNLFRAAIWPVSF